MKITKRNKAIYIGRYLEKDLSPEEVALVENRIKTDAAFAEDVKLSKSIDEFFSKPKNMERIEMRQQLQSIRKDYIRKRKPIYKISLFFKNLFHKE